MTMYDESKDLMDAYRAGPTVIEAMLHGCSQEQARAARGGDEGWSVVEVLCHLRDAEERALQRILAMRDEDDPAIAGYDQEAWARERNYAGDDMRRALAAFQDSRAQHVAELAALAPAAWERTGRHAEQGTITISAHT